MPDCEAGQCSKAPVSSLNGFEEQNEEWNSHSLCGMTSKSSFKKAQKGGLNERISYNEQTKISSQRRKRLISSYCKDIIAVDVSQISDYHFFSA